MPRTGRPPKLTEVIGRVPIFNDDGDAVGMADQTRLEAIVADIRVGLNAERACDRHDVKRQTLKAWEAIAHDVRKRAAQQPDEDIECTEYELACVDFSDALHAAELEWHSGMELLLQDLSQGGRKVDVITVEEKGGEVVKSTTKTSYTLPDADVIKWRLKHRFPAEYADRVQIEGTGEDGAIKVDIGARADAIADALEHVLAEAADDDKPKLAHPIIPGETEPIVGGAGTPRRKHDDEP